MNTSITAADLDGESAPGTPGAGGDAGGEEDADWVYAQREAALARLHGLDPGLESLPDEDLNKLFDRITKLKTMRGHTSLGGRPDSSMEFFRPESSMGIHDNNLSLTDDVWSDMPGQTFYGDSTTDDTSLETNTFGSPELDDSSARDMQGQLEATKLDFEHRLSAIEESDQADDLKVEKEHVEQQLQMVQRQMKRLLELRAKGASEEAFEAFEPTLYSAKELRLIRKVLHKWRAHRAFSMAETVLSGAVHVKEANVMRFVAPYDFACIFLD